MNLGFSNELYKYQSLTANIQFTSTRNRLPLASVTLSPKVIVTHAVCMGGECPIEANQYSKSERNTADMKGVYVSEFIHGGVYDETCG